MNQDTLRGFLKFESEIRGYLWGLVRDRAESEDLLQEVAVVVTRKPFSGSEKKMRIWFLKIARGVALNYRKKNRRRKTVILPSDAMAELISDLMIRQPRHPDAVSREMAALRECLERMEGRKRELLRLRFFESMGHEEIARIFRRSSGSIRKAIHRARGALLGCLHGRLAGRGSAE